MAFDFDHGGKQHYACFGCRKAFKPRRVKDEFVRDEEGNRRRRVVKCPECQQPMKAMGILFRAPSKRAVKAWRKLKELALQSPGPVFARPRVRPVKGACPNCGSRTGWDGKRCPYCGHVAKDARKSS